MEEHIRKMLLKEDEPDNIKALREDIIKWLKHSRGEMRKNYAGWNRNLRIFNSRRLPDEQDHEARDLGEPEKMIVPMSYSQIQTFVSFAFMLYLQNQNFYEFQAQRNTAYPLEEICERIIQRDLNHNEWNSKLYQSLLDLSRFGVCAFKSVWKVAKQWIQTTTPGTADGVGPFNMVNAAQPINMEVTRFEGNDIINISPYKLFPDMRLPLTRWREGRFVADELEYHISYLKDLERKGVLAGTEHLKSMDKREFKNSNRELLPEVEDMLVARKKDPDDFMTVSTEGHFIFRPSDYDLGPEKYDCDYIINMANDQRLLRVEKAGYLHGEFIYDLAQLSPDSHCKINRSLSDQIHPLQDVVTWLINARVMSVRRSLDSHLVVDPSAVDTTSLEARSPIIYMRKGAPKTGVQNFVQQLKITDTTASHFQDAELLMKIMQTITGVNDNAMGQYNGGRRSATEARATNAGAAGRMKVVAQLAWSQCYGPMGRKLLTNLRQNLTQESFTKIIGRESPNTAYDIGTMWQLFQPKSPRDLVGNEDFFVFDSTLQSEKSFLAQSLQELVQAMMSNPEIIGLLGFDIGKMIDEIQYLRGVNNVARFRIAGTASGVVPGPAGAGGVAPVAGGNGAALQNQVIQDAVSRIQGGAGLGVANGAGLRA